MMMSNQRLQRLTEGYNMIPNLAWTILFMGPVVAFCYSLPDIRISLITLGVCLVPAFFPNSFFDAVQLSRRPAFYERLGVRFINQFAQHGLWINRYLRKKYPEWKGVAPTRSAMIKRYRETYFYERFHFALFLFYTVMTVYALIYGQWSWALILTISNLLYNIYPNLLQQYIRAKMPNLLSKRHS
jgi:hypothetical protein